MGLEYLPTFHIQYMEHLGICLSKKSSHLDDVFFNCRFKDFNFNLKTHSVGIVQITPPKTNVEPENQPLEEKIPMKKHHF